MDFDVVRPREFLLARFSFKGYRLEEPASDRRILVPDGSEPPLIIVSLPPQSIAEQAYITGSRLPDVTPKSAAAGWTRLVFAPADRAISFALGPVLEACANAPLATGPPFVDREHLHRPGPSETAIEFPYGVLLAAGDSQHRFRALAAAAAPDAATAELWNLFLMRAGDGETTAEIRWIYPDRDHDFALTGVDRQKLRSAVFGPGPQLAKIEKLWLSSLGGTGSLVADFPTSPVLETWRHRAMLGRDAYVKVVTRGFLYPLGHRAAAVEIVRRELFTNDDPLWRRKAFLRRIRYIVLRQRTVAASQRDLPFTSMTIEQETTPELTIDNPSAKAFLVKVGNRPFPFSISAQDRSGRPVTLSMPLVFMETTANLSEAELAALVSHAEDAYKGFEVVSGRGQPIAYVPKKDDDARQGLETVALTFATRSPVTPAGAFDPPFSPRISRALARVPEMQAMTAGASETMIEYAPEYLNGGKDGFDGKKNPAAVFARFIPGSELPFGLGAGRQVGLARPDMVLGGLSRDTGIVAGDTVALTAALIAPDVAKEMDKYCKKGLADVTLLGGVRLMDLLELGGDAINDLPKTVVKPIFEAAGSAPVGFEAKLTWTPRIRPHHPVLTFLGGGGRPLSITSVSLTRAGETPETNTTAELKNPKINFLGVASVEFALLRFSTRSGAKPELTAEKVDLTFRPPLSFVADLAGCLPDHGFSDPPALAVDTSGARLGYSVGLPTVGVGVFSLQNIAVSAALRVPFDGAPMRLSFAFCRRDEPFLLTVSLFGGGGFLGLEFGVDRITLLEASIEFGGAFALNLGVASGGVFVMAGFYFKLATVAGSPDTELTELTGYFRCGGSVEVLCIISISVEFYLALTYKKQGTQTVLRGVARLTVTVEIAFFSKDVTLEVERTFAGSAGDPTFGDLMGSADWDRYCNAFAVEGA